MALAFSTKGQTLQALQHHLSFAQVLPFRLFKQTATVESLNDFLEEHKPLIARSSSTKEDLHHQSNAGKYLSITGIDDSKKLASSIDAIFQSYDDDTDIFDEEVLIQPQLQKPLIVGVMFTKVPSNGSDYYVINFDSNGSHDAVTSGSSNELHTCYIAKGCQPDQDLQNNLVLLAVELQELFDTSALDIEFAVGQDGELYLLQVRPLIVPNLPKQTSKLNETAREEIKRQLTAINKPHPYLFGRRTLFGMMPDWNPAEIIGVRPKTLALSLYKELITDNIWAYQRSNYGYMNLRSFPLLISFHGMPFIDVRVSFNSFVPRELPPEIADKLVNYYLDKLEQNPAQHDKVEFNVVLSCYTLDIENKLNELRNAGFNDTECAVLASQLRAITNRIIDPRTGLWIQDLHKLEKLKIRQHCSSRDIDDIQQRIYWQIEDCKRYGTLPFAGLARAGFIAVQMLHSMVAEKVITEVEFSQFMNSLNTVSSEMTKDFTELTRGLFLEKYGHLRPGTYDIQSPRYDEAPDLYFNWSKKPTPLFKEEFKLSTEGRDQCAKLLSDHGINHSPESLLHFIKNAIEGREYAKFVFTKSLSDALQNIAKLGSRYGIDSSEIAFLNVQDLLSGTYASEDIETLIRESIKQGKKHYEITKYLNLPPLLYKTQQVDSFDMPQSSPNFITEKKIVAPTIEASNDSQLKGKVVFITNADPGYDWLFSHSIAGLVTQFGGCNSHMAIRANELEIPAVIGAGETLYNSWKKAEIIELDPVNKKVTAMR